MKPHTITIHPKDEKLYTEKQCLNAVTEVLTRWKTACFNMKGGLNIEFLAEIELALKNNK